MSSSLERIEAHTTSGGSLRFDIPKSSASRDQGKHAGGLENAAPQCTGGNGVVPLNKPFPRAGPLHGQSSSNGITVMHGDGIAGELHPFGQSQCHERERPSDFSHEQPNANYFSSLHDNESIPSKGVVTETVSSANQTDSRVREAAKQMVHCKAPSIVTSQTVNVHGKASQSPAQDMRVGIGIALKKARFQSSPGKDVIPKDSSLCSGEKRAIHLKDERVDNVDNPDDVYIDLKTGSKVKAALCPTFNDANLRKYGFVTNETGESGFRKHEGCGKMEVMIGVVLALLVLTTFMIGAVVQLQMRVSAMEKIMANIELNKIAENSGLQNFLSDNGELFLKTLFYLNIDEDWDDGQKQKSNNEPKGRILSRHTRDLLPQKDRVTPENKTQQTSSIKKGTKNKEQNKAATLESSQFEFDFFDEWYDYRTNFTKQECFQDKRWPTQPFACRGSTIRYPQRDSPLAFYAPQDRKHTGQAHRTRKRKGNTPLVEISNRSEGYFSVRESGVYLIHLNIMIVDETQNHSLGIFLNNLTVLACPRGGFRCPHTNAEGSYKYRICNIDGILEMNVKDQLQIRTMEPNTTVRFDNKRKSQFRAVLLHKSTKANS